MPMGRAQKGGCMQERRQGTRLSVCGVAAWRAIPPFKTTIGSSRLSKKEVGRVSAYIQGSTGRVEESEISALTRGGNKPQGFKT
jgi:hypothetical protein